MKIQLSTIFLSIILLICLIGLGAVIFAFIPKDCQHHSCNTTLHEPTCDEKGYTYYVCKKCKYAFEADFVAPLGHQLTSTVIAPTCDTEGYTSHYCSVCEINDKDNYAIFKAFARALSDASCLRDGNILSTKGTL